MSEVIDRPRTVPSAVIYRRLLGYASADKGIVSVALIAMFFTAATEWVFPFLMQRLLDDGFGPNRTIEYWMVPTAVIGLFAIRGVCTFTSTYALRYIEQKVLTALRRQMFARLISLPTATFDKTSGASLLSRLTYDVNWVTDTGSQVLKVVVLDTLTVLGLMAYLLYSNWQLTAIVFIQLPVIAAIIWVFSRRMRKLNRQNMDFFGQMAHVVEEAIHSQKVIKVYGGMAHESARFFRASEALRNFARRLTTASALQVPLTQLIAACAVSAVIVSAMATPGAGTATVGGFAGYVTAMLMLLAPLKRLADINTPLQRGLAAAEAVFAFIDQPPESDRGEVTVDRVRGTIEFERVSLRYESAETDALDQVSFVIEAGQSVALVGTSGGGKTSIANLIPRYYQPTSGQIKIDGIPIEHLTLAALRRQIAFVGQDVMLFNDTIAANIAYGDSANAPIERIREAAKAAHLDDFILGLPEAYQTQIGDNGVRLSGGQRQRLAIARALLKDAPILILDEATSALDNESERHVQAALEVLMKSRTTLIIAHRLSTVEHADRILVLSQGRIVESGDHHSLLAKQGLYSRLYRELEV